MGRPVTLPTPPWEDAPPKPKKKNRSIDRFPRGMPWLERYWGRKLLTDTQFHAACKLRKAYWQSLGASTLPTYRERVDGGQSEGIEGRLDQGALYRELSRAVPPEYWPYVRHVVIEDRSLWSFQGCSGGANMKRYLKRLGLGLEGVG